VTYGKEEILDRKVPELPAGQRVDKVLLVEMLIGSYTVRSRLKSPKATHLEEQKVPFGHCKSPVLPESRTSQSRGNRARRTR